MLKINVLSVGKIKEDYYNQAIAEYAKRLGRFCNISQTIIEELPQGQDKLKKESQLILPKLSNFTVILDKEGQALTSLQLASKLQLWQNSNSDITILIGSSDGLDQTIKQIANYSMSFSCLTLPHSLAKVILFEQLYRAFMINSNGKYHK
ncbi:MAG: 23S rRNA (pseudouridine(1915)-N(3))-methyltransferase RlmH [Clostridia bacterium]